MKSPSSTTVLYAIAGLVVLAVIVFAFFKKNAPSPYDTFAQCVTDSQAKMYGAWWCPHCTQQKKQFGNAFENIEYIECSTPQRTMTLACKDAKIEGYPTWEFGDGSRLSGEQSFAVLAEKTGCALPEQTP